MLWGHQATIEQSLLNKKITLVSSSIARGASHSPCVGLPAKVQFDFELFPPSSYFTRTFSKCLNFCCVSGFSAIVIFFRLEFLHCLVLCCLALLSLALLSLVLSCIADLVLSSIADLVLSCIAEILPGFQLSRKKCSGLGTFCCLHICL